eukprot:767089-Hanusia_phi.AAC.2
MLHCRLLQRQHVHKVLAVPSNPQLRVSPHFSAARVELAQHEAKQCRLPAAVGSHDGNARVRPEPEVDVLKDVGPLLVGEAHVTELQVGGSKLWRFGEVKPNFVLFGLGEDRGVLLVLLLARLAVLVPSLPPPLAHGLCRLRFTLARCLEGLEGLLLLLPRSRPLCLLRFELRAEGVISSAVVEEPALVQVDGVRADGVEEVDVMRDDDEVVEPQDCVEVQVVGRLVEEEESRADEEGACKGDAHPPASGKRRRRSLVPGQRKPQPQQDPARFALRGVCSHGFDFELVSLLQQRFALDVSLEHELQRSLAGGRDLLLDHEHVDVPGDRDRLLSDVHQQRRLALPVRANQPVAIPRRDVKLRVLQQNFTANADGKPRDADVLAHAIGSSFHARPSLSQRKVL